MISKATFILLLFFSTTILAQEKSFIIKGKFSQPTTEKNIQFVQKSNNSKEEEKTRNIPIVNGGFTIEGKIKEPQAANLKLGNDSNQVLFFLDEGKTEITINGELAKAKIVGSKTTNDYRAFIAADEVFATQFKDLSDKANASLKDGKHLDSVNKDYYADARKLNQKYIQFHKSFITKEKSSFLSLLLLPKLVEMTGNYVQADSLFNVLSSDVTKTETAKGISELIGREMKTSIGAFAQEISLLDTAGKAFALSSLKGKYVLLDFWASWCGPCRQENPNVVEAYNRFKGNGFTILGVSLDQDKKNWMKAIHVDKLSWDHVSDLKGWNSSAAALYGIRAIPRNFLLDPEGKIIAKDLRGPELLSKLEEILVKRKDQ